VNGSKAIEIVFSPPGDCIVMLQTRMDKSKFQSRHSISAELASNRKKHFQRAIFWLPEHSTWSWRKPIFHHYKYTTVWICTI